MTNFAGIAVPAADSLPFDDDAPTDAAGASIEINECAGIFSGTKDGFRSAPEMGIIGDLDRHSQSSLEWFRQRGFPPSEVRGEGNDAITSANKPRDGDACSNHLGRMSKFGQLSHRLSGNRHGLLNGGGRHRNPPSRHDTAPQPDQCHINRVELRVDRCHKPVQSCHHSRARAARSLSGSVINFVHPARSYQCRNQITNGGAVQSEHLG